MGTEVEAPKTGALAERDAHEAGSLEGFDSSDLILPLVKLTQGQSKEVQAGDAEPGEFVNTLTNEVYGEPLSVVVFAAFKGRFFASDEEDRTYIASGPTAPESWPEQYAGQRFADIPDAEETFKERANANEIEWGSGPPIRTTYNFVGFSMQEPGVPIRLSLMRTSAPAGKTLASMLRLAAANWDNAYQFTSEQRSDRKSRPYHVVQVTRGPQTDADTREQAKQMNEEYARAQVKFTGDDIEGEAKPVKPEEPEDGLGI